MERFPGVGGCFVQFPKYPHFVKTISKIAPSFDKERILIRVLVTCLLLQKTKNDIRQMIFVEHAYLVTFLRVTLLFMYDQMPHGLINIAVESVLICMLNKCRLPYINVSTE